MNAIAALNQKELIVYPESDGTPMGETEIHIQALIDALVSLKEFFRQQPDVYIAGNMFLYYEEGNPAAVEAPDIFVAKGVSKERRRIYQLWKENAAPCFVLEFTSKSSQVKDQVNKKAIYEMLGVKEYFLFDPEEDYLAPSLQGYVLREKGYEHLDSSEDGSLMSRELGLRLQREGLRLRMIDLKTGEPLLSYSEQAEARQKEAEARRKAEQKAGLEEEARRKAEQKAGLEEEARRKAESELERLKAELERLRGNE